jgi:two-component system C4-dicarboxylate transport sensor histidine kinase DctB
VPEPAQSFEDQESRAKLARLYRYAQVGHCVSSVTHDINNFLGAILAYAELVGLEGNQTPEARRMLGEIMTAVRKSTRLVSSLTDIARRERPDVRVVSPEQVLESVLELRRYDLKVGRIELETQCPQTLPEISMDLPKLEQALIYVLSNAIEALEGCQDRRLKVSLADNDGNVAIRIWNSGETIADDIREQVFEPLFTTKAGDHLGLGLWVARNNLREYGGDLTYDPDSGFTLIVPREADVSTVRGAVARAQK